MSTFIYITSSCILMSISLTGQTINYVSNGSFEDCVNCVTPPYQAMPVSWGAIDSIQNSSSFYFCSLTPPIANLPNFSTGFQYPRTGNNLILSQFYCDLSTCTFTSQRGYPKNRLRQTLKQNNTYCAKYYVVNTNNCVVGMDAYGAYFGANELDTINYYSVPLSYLTPQIQNPSGNIITDTLNWIAISGTFVATGTEKFMVLGNFKSNNSTNTLIINPTFLPNKSTDLYIDDVSVFELDAPAYAGPDQSIMPGDSVYIGSPRDFATDEICRWYQLPNDTVPLDSVAGLWVKPAVTSTYVVRQQLWCSGVKWDTVVISIYSDPVGMEKLRFAGSLLRVSPVPADEILRLSFEQNDITPAFNSVIILNNLGQVIRNKEIIFEKNAASIKTDDLPEGVYTLQLRVAEGLVNKRFVIAR